MKTLSAKAYSRLQERGRTLFSEGYTLHPTAVSTRWYIYTPKKSMYLVSLDQGTCTCPSFANREVCKHLVALRRLFRQEKEAE